MNDEGHNFANFDSPGSSTGTATNTAPAEKAGLSLSCST